MALYAFDGTWNSEKDAGEYDRNTNVVRFKDLYTGTKFFYKGVGTKHGTLGKFAGGAFGVGGHERIEDAKRDMAKQFADGDRDIDIVGLQPRRGAGGALRQRGRRRRREASTACSKSRRCASSASGTSSRPSAFPINLGFNFNRINLGYKLGLVEGA